MSNILVLKWVVCIVTEELERVKQKFQNEHEINATYRYSLRDEQVRSHMKIRDFAYWKMQVVLYTIK